MTNWYLFNSRGYIFAVEAPSSRWAKEIAKTIDGFGHGYMGLFDEDECINAGCEDFYDFANFGQI